MDTITIISLLIGVLGLVTTLWAAALTYYTYINPKIRVDCYLKKPSDWEKVRFGLNGGNSLWRFKKHPEFIVEQQDDYDTWDPSVTEKWMKYPLPDPSKTTYMMHVKAGNIVVYAELFITLDGGRYLVPLPRVKHHHEKDKNEYFYTPLQVKIGNIIGEFYCMQSLDDFIAKNEIKVRGDE